jgi:hypothetical protein
MTLNFVLLPQYAATMSLNISNLLAAAAALFPVWQELNCCARYLHQFEPLKYK